MSVSFQKSNSTFPLLCFFSFFFSFIMTQQSVTFYSVYKRLMKAGLRSSGGCVGFVVTVFFQSITW